MKHFGDITQLDGHELPFVDCIIGGSPCQDLSVAGKREGLQGARSGLFMEQVRVEWVTAAAPFPSLGDYTMHSFGESPSEENASRLSQILEDSAPQKYCLSAKACAGILNRAQKRGKELPCELREALERQIGLYPQN